MLLRYWLLSGEKEMRTRFQCCCAYIPGKVIRYDFKDKSSTKLCDFNPTVDQGIGTGPENESKFVGTMFNVFQYIESLACVCFC